MMSDDSSSEYSYAGSEASVESSQGIPIQAVASKLQDAFDPMPLDRALVQQAQLSGLLNSRAHKLAELQQKVTDRLPEIKALHSKGKEVQKQINNDLAWLKKHLGTLEPKVKSNYPIEYARAKDQVDPSAL